MKILQWSNVAYVGSGAGLELIHPTAKSVIALISDPHVKPRAGAKCILECRHKSNYTDKYKMREFIDTVALFESQGIANRKPGDVFVDADGNEIYFQRIDFYPAGGGAYPDAATAQEAVGDIQSQLGTQLIADPKNRPSLAFGVAQFADAEGNPINFIKYFKEINPDAKRNHWSNKDGIPGFRFASASATKMQSDAAPTQVLTQLDNLTAQDIALQVRQRYPDSTLSEVTEYLAAGGELPYSFAAPSEMSITAFRDLFCEMLQPIALQTGQFTGEALDAAAVFLPETGFADTVISFGDSMTAGLSDSIMTAPSGQFVKVSSKGGSGAAAALKNILDVLTELQLNPNGQALLDQYQETVELLQTVDQNNQYQGPLVLGERFGIITGEDREYINFIGRKVKPIKLELISELPGISDNLVSIARGRKTKSPDAVNPYFHLVSAVAHRVAEYVNDNTDFSKQGAAILNNGALVQVYTRVSSRGDTWTLQPFESRWPGSAVTTLSFDADKNYSSTSIKGKFTFVVNKKKKPAVDTGSQSDLTDVSFKRAGLKASDTKKIGSEKSLGRKRRS